MRRWLIGVAAAGIMVFGIAYPLSGMARSPVVLIMGEDWDKASISRSSIVFKRIVHAISSRLGDEGFRVKDEASVLKDNFIKRRISRTKDDSLQIAREINNPTIDALVTVGIYPKIENADKTTVVNALVVGRILNVSTSDHIGNFDIMFPQGIPISQSCVVHRECVLRAIADQAHIIAESTVVPIAMQLREAMIFDQSDDYRLKVKPQKPAFLKSYILTFQNLSQSEFNQIEAALVGFSGYHSHNVNVIFLRHTKVIYETRSEDETMKRNLRKFVGFMNIGASVRCMNMACNITKF